MINTNSHPSNSELENARTEYIAANEVYLHYDNFSWQVGSILVAGSFAYWGLLSGSTPTLLSINIGNLLICLVMTVWILYTSHNRQIYKYKLHRIWELEKTLNMHQHRRFRDKNYILNGPRGHILDYCIYILISIGSMIIGWNLKYKGEWDYINCVLFVSVLFIVTVILSYVCIVDNNTTNEIKTWKDKINM